MKLSDGVEHYVAWKHRKGVQFEKGESTLRAFLAHAGDIQLTEVMTEQILIFLNRNPVSTITWRLRYGTLSCFFHYWLNREMVVESKMPPPKRLVRQSFVPYVFTKAELASLLAATKRHRSTRLGLGEYTFQSVILFLYGTGVTVGEAARMLAEDVDLALGFITIRSARESRARRIPVGVDLQKLLTSYMVQREKAGHRSPYLFLNKTGRQISTESLSKNFQRLRRPAAIFCYDESSYQPRVDDLRCTFAVHRISKWIEDGAELNRMLPALAAYMGQVGLGSTERYLFLTPERFRADLNKLSPTNKIGEWHGSQELMTFLHSFTKN